MINFTVRSGNTKWFTKVLSTDNSSVSISSVTPGKHLSSDRNPYQSKFHRRVEVGNDGLGQRSRSGHFSPISPDITPTSDSSIPVGL